MSWPRLQALAAELPFVPPVELAIFTFELVTSNRLDASIRTIPVEGVARHLREELNDAITSTPTSLNMPPVNTPTLTSPAAVRSQWIAGALQGSMSVMLTFWPLEKSHATTDTGECWTTAYAAVLSVLPGSRP